MKSLQFLGLLAFSFIVLFLLPLKSLTASENTDKKALLAIQEAWVRPTVKGQTVTGAYFKVTANQAGKIIGVQADVAGKAELHEMIMKGDVMQMRRLPEISLQKGDAIAFEQGSKHIMLMSLHEQIKPESTVELELLFKDKQGSIHTLPFKAFATHAPIQH